MKPDGFGRYLHPRRACEFYLEYDRATEASGALSRKLEGYLKLAAGWTREEELAGFPNLLVLVPEGGREGEVATALRSATTSLHVSDSLANSFPLYVASEDQLTEIGVLGPVWNHVPTDGERLSFIDLPARSRDLYRKDTVSRSLLHRRRPRPSASHLPRIRHAPIPRPAAPTCTLRPRREDAPTEAGVTRRREKGDETRNDEREGQGNCPDTGQGPVWTEDDVSLMPLARALLALAEQLMGEEAP